jgi:hypothetical protein
MPTKKHLRGVNSKEQRQYEHIKESAQSSGRYGKRAKEVAARTVLKQHKEKGHRRGNSPKLWASLQVTQISIVKPICKASLAASWRPRSRTGPK